MCFEGVRLTDRPELLENAAQWFHQKWGIPLEEYKGSMLQALEGPGPVPEWYLALEKGKIIGGLGVIENDFHPRRDLSPNVCAVYTEPERRGMGVAGMLLRLVCEDMKAKGIETLYLLTGHDSFYERYGWEYFCPVAGDGEEEPSRMYIHRG